MMQVDGRANLFHAPVQPMGLQVFLLLSAHNKQQQHLRRALKAFPKQSDQRPVVRVTQSSLPALLKCKA